MTKVSKAEFKLIELITAGKVARKAPVSFFTSIKR